MSEQAKALELANFLDAVNERLSMFDEHVRGCMTCASEELRRLHSVNAELLEALQRLSAQAERLRLPGQTPGDAEKTAFVAISRALGQ